MSSNHPFLSVSGLNNSSSVSDTSSQADLQQVVEDQGEINHVNHLSEHIGALFLDSKYSDIRLIIDGQTFDAHRVILAARSDYFRAMLYGGMKESNSREIEIKDTSLHAFKHLLKYLYTGQMNLADLKHEMVLEMLGLAHQYGFQELETAISDYLKATLKVSNVCYIYDSATLYLLDNLVSSCLLFMDKNASEIILHESFNSLTAQSIKAIISRDSFCAPEVAIFKAVNEWVNSNPDEEPGPILEQIRLSLMSTPDLLKVVRPTGLVPPDVLLDAIQSKTECRDMELKYRGYLIPDENVAQTKHGAQVLIGESKHALLNGENSNYDLERGYSRHAIGESQDKGIVIKLGMQCIVNHIRMLLWDKDQRSYSYYIDVSMDQQDWVRVVDHSKYHCRSWQHLFFSS